MLYSFVNYTVFQVLCQESTDLADNLSYNFVFCSVKGCYDIQGDENA